MEGRGGGGREARRTAAAAAAAAAEEALRSGCEEVLRLKQVGDTDGAIVLAMNLADQYPRSASPYNLMGFLVEGQAAKVLDRIDNMPAQVPGRVRLSDTDDDPGRIAEDRARCRYTADRAAIISHLASYHQASAEWYGKAVHRAPRCPVTRANYARMLGMSDQTALAYREFNSAIHITNPDCPEKSNPWIESTDVGSDEKKKASAILMARDEFNRFLYFSDSDVYNTCCDLLLNLRKTQGTPGVTAKKEAKKLAAKYPFSARANLLGPFLMRQLIDSSASSVPKLIQYKQLLREIADCVDQFPDSIVISLFRAEVLFDMGYYLEATMECLRGLNIAKPDDPVSQDIPAGSASGSARKARIGTVTIKLINLLEESEQKITDAKEIEKLLQALSLTHEDEDVKCLVKELVLNLNKKLLKDLSSSSEAAEKIGTSCKEQSGNVLAKMPEGLSNQDNNNEAVKAGKLCKKPMKQALTAKPVLNIDAGQVDADKGKAVTRIPQSVLYSDKLQRLTKKKAEPLQIVGTRIVPRETVDMYAEYCFHRSFCSAKKVTCHLCIFEDNEYYRNAIPKGDMILHCVNEHKEKGSYFKCDLKTCDARLRTEDDKELHHHYCHVLDKDWWKHW